MTDLYSIAARRAAFESLAEFIPRAGRQHTSSHNFDLGPTDRSNVFTLSPWISHRTLTEEHVTSKVLQRHSLQPADKFVRDVGWRTYLTNLENQRIALVEGGAPQRRYHDAWRIRLA